MQNQEAEMDSTTTRRNLGVGLLPFFEDWKVYDGIKILAGQKKLRSSSVVIEAVKAYSAEWGKVELDTVHAKRMHEQLEELNKKRKTRSIADYIEVCCVHFIEQEFRKRMPNPRGG